jgi:hypothetical protein
MSKTRQKRIVELVKEYEDATIVELSEKRLVAQRDEELFTVDTTGRHSRKRKTQIDDSSSALRHPPSKAESRLIKKLLVSSKKSADPIEASGLRDIWIDSEEVSAEAGSAKRPPAGCSIALPGQSYNPSPRDHQNILAEAVALEIIKKEHAERFEQPGAAVAVPGYVPAGGGAGEDDREGQDHDDDEEEENADADEGSVEAGRGGAGRPKTVTRAQRNKKRRHSVELNKKLSEDRNRRLMQSIDQLPKMLQEMAAAELRRSVRKVLEL